MLTPEVTIFSNVYKGSKFQRNSGAGSVGEYDKVIHSYQSS